MQRDRRGAGSGDGLCCRGLGDDARCCPLLAPQSVIRRAPTELHLSIAQLQRNGEFLRKSSQKTLRPAGSYQPRQMSSLDICTSEVTTLVRPYETRVTYEDSSDSYSNTSEETELPECKIKRNYNCLKCKFFTQNPREFLVHSRDVHYEKIKIFDCSYCVYASRQHQKLLRHIKMIHENSTTVTEHNTIEESTEQIESMEDLLEEIEETNEDDQTEITNYRQNNRASVGAKKNKFFACDKCNYATHIRSRYTKHVKYHTMPMIKCTVCNFRTPYKWNLDRHMKNHGGTGSFNCSMCNFTADIKQSLTVHEMNHHEPPSGHTGPTRRRNRVGGSDIAATMITKEEDGSGDSQCVSENLNADIELVSCNSESNEATDLKFEKCDVTQEYCKDNLLHEQLTKHEESQGRKRARPLPQLIPLNSSTPSKSSEPQPKKSKLESNSKTMIDSLPCDISLIPVNPIAPSNKDSTLRKKNESFFDKLKERLLTETGDKGTLTCKNCGFESKCLSEHSVHEKNCSAIGTKTPPIPTVSSLGSTRCQNCRHRCKSSADLILHMQTCGNVMKAVQPGNGEPERSILKDTEHEYSVKKDSLPHPMENVVFVWNNINQDKNKFSPLGVNINDDSTLPELHRDAAEIIEENDGMNMSPSQAVGKKVFKCPRCPFWASTASRFHVHIVGHLNKKPFECSLCKYKSNWRWDITKHIKLKSARDPEHNDAKVLMTDETGRRNYSKYTRFLAMLISNENGENEFVFIDQEAATVDASMEFEESTEIHGEPLDLHTDSKSDPAKPKKTMWKCKKCNYRDPSKEALLEHVREHSRDPEEIEISKSKKLEGIKDPSELAYRCGHCNQLSNWKHVIQRHCRLKHSGIIKVIAIERSKLDLPLVPPDDMGEFCTKCPYQNEDKKQLLKHIQQHKPSENSIFKCYFCYFFVKNEEELLQHLTLHGVTEPEEFVAKTMSGKKRHKCSDCPYETNSKSQYKYHEQFHKLTPMDDSPYKCQECNYSVSKRHLLHQHMRVHGIIIKKSDDFDGDASTSNADYDTRDKSEPFENQEIPYVWVAAKNEFHKMYKCRYCSYVNSQKCKIPNHEKIHCISAEGSDAVSFKCLECKFTSDDPWRLSDHARTHGEIYGRIYCEVEENIPDEEQILKLRKQLEEDRLTMSDNSERYDFGHRDSDDNKMIYFCQKCPARYFSESEIRMHDRFHESKFANKCKYCEYCVPQESQLACHAVVHTDDYRAKTKALSEIHEAHCNHSEPQLELLHSPNSSDITWVVSTPSKVKLNINCYKKNETKTPKQYNCSECPAKFFKNSALTYHSALHNGEGDHKCKKCSYTVKNIGNLAKHEMLHEANNKPNCEYESGDDMDFKHVPLSGTDLFQRKTEAQKRVLTDKSKLVKPNDHFPPVLQADPQFGYLMHGNPEFIYPTYMKNGRQKEKRYKCHKCPSAFEKREQYKIHLSLHGSKQRYKCEICDYSVKYYANYVQHMRKHQMNDEAQAERNKSVDALGENESQDICDEPTDFIKLAIKTIPKGVPRSDFQQFSVSDQQTLRILQRRRSINNACDTKSGDLTTPAKDRKQHMCTLCPYTNQRLDSLENHYKRHDKSDLSNSGYNKCPHCELAVVNFLRDHIKSHFKYQKQLSPQCFVANEDVRFKIVKIDDSDANLEKEEIIFSLDVNKSDILESSGDKILVQVSTGEVIE